MDLVYEFNYIDSTGKLSGFLEENAEPCGSGSFKFSSAIDADNQMETMHIIYKLLTTSKYASHDQLHWDLTSILASLIKQ